MAAPTAASPSPASARPTPHSERHYENARFPSFQDAIEAYIAEVGTRPTAGVVAIAGPVAGEVVGPTNLPRWRFRPPSLASALNFSRLDVINDFEAVAQALPYLPTGETVAVGDVIEGVKGGNVAVLGPGTGLGVGALVRAGPRWAAVPSEGGHAEIGAPLGALGQSARDHPRPCRPRLGRACAVRARAWSVSTRPCASSTARPSGCRRPRSASRAIAGTDRIATEAVKLFFDYLARFSGDVALMFAAKGGIYLYGGVVQKLSRLDRAGSLPHRLRGQEPARALPGEDPDPPHHQFGAGPDRLRRGRRRVGSQAGSAAVASPGAGRRRMRSITKTAMATWRPALWR